MPWRWFLNWRSFFFILLFKYFEILLRVFYELSIVIMKIVFLINCKNKKIYDVFDFSNHNLIFNISTKYIFLIILMFIQIHSNILIKRELKIINLMLMQTYLADKNDICKRKIGVKSKKFSRLSTRGWFPEISERKILTIKIEDSEVKFVRKWRW